MLLRPAAIRLRRKLHIILPKPGTLSCCLWVAVPVSLETFDYKPALKRLDGTLPPVELLDGYRAAFINPKSKLLGPKYGFARHGECGAELSELLPHTASVADDLAVIRSMKTDAFNHAPAQVLMSTGSPQFGRPSMGSWVTYGLGSESRDLPAYIVFNSGKKGPSGGTGNWSSGFLPTVHSGVEFRSHGDPVLYLSNPDGIDRTMQRQTLDAINQINRGRLDALGDSEIATRINSYEMAFRMQSSAPSVMDLVNEPKHILEMYGANPVSRHSPTTVCWHDASSKRAYDLCSCSMNRGINMAI